MHVSVFSLSPLKTLERWKEACRLHLCGPRPEKYDPLDGRNQVVLHQWSNQQQQQQQNHGWPGEKSGQKESMGRCLLRFLTTGRVLQGKLSDPKLSLPLKPSIAGYTWMDNASCSFHALEMSSDEQQAAQQNIREVFLQNYLPLVAAGENSFSEPSEAWKEQKKEG